MSAAPVPLPRVRTEAARADGADRSAARPAPAPEAAPLARAAPADVPAITRLLWAAVPGCSTATLRELPRDWPHYRVLRDEKGDVIAAAALVPSEPGCAELRGLTVAPSHRGRGLCGRLLRSLTAEADAAGRELRCVSRRPGLFQRHGFRTDEPDWLRRAPRGAPGFSGRRVPMCRPPSPPPGQRRSRPESP